jgi:hypothetical protein
VPTEKPNRLLFHPIDEDLSLGTPVFHPIDEDPGFSDSAPKVEHRLENTRAETSAATA